MKALVARRHGEPSDVLELGEAEPPPLGVSQARVAPEAVGLNFLDVSVCRGDYPLDVQPPLVVGAEFAGRVLEVASDVSGLAVGDRVAGFDPQRPLGALADEVVAPAEALVEVPAELPAATAAVLLVTYQTAWFALHRRARLLAGETVLVHAGAGGVGTATIQLARAAGARVIATARGEDKAALCRAQGADHALDVTTEDFVAAVHAHTDGAGADVVCDPVGGELFERSLDCLAFEGRILPLGWASGRMPAIDPLRIVAGNHDVLGLSWGSAYPRLRPELVRAVHEDLLRLHAEGSIEPLISSVVPLPDAPAALQRLGDGLTVGKVVIAL